MGGRRQAGALPVVFLRFRQAVVTGDTTSAAGSYDVDAAFMSLQVHDRGIHAVRPGAGEADVMEVRFTSVRMGAGMTQAPARTARKASGSDGLPADASWGIRDKDEG